MGFEERGGGGGGRGAGDRKELQSVPVVIFAVPFLLVFVIFLFFLPSFFNVFFSFFLLFDIFFFLFVCVSEGPNSKLCVKEKKIKRKLWEIKGQKTQTVLK